LLALLEEYEKVLKLIQKAVLLVLLGISRLQNRLSKRGDHEKLLRDRVHVAGRPLVFQPNIAALAPLNHSRRVIPGPLSIGVLLVKFHYKVNKLAKALGVIVTTLHKERKCSLSREFFLAHREWPAFVILSHRKEMLFEEKTD